MEANETPFDATVTFQDPPVVVTVEPFVDTDVPSEDPEATGDWTIEAL